MCPVPRFRSHGSASRTPQHNKPSTPAKDCRSPEAAKVTLDHRPYRWYPEDTLASFLRSSPDLEESEVVILTRHASDSTAMQGKKATERHVPRPVEEVRSMAKRFPGWVWTHEFGSVQIRRGLDAFVEHVKP